MLTHAVFLLQYMLGMPDQALSVLQGVLLQLHTHCSLFHRARVSLLLIKCRVARSKNLPTSQRQPGE